MDSGPIQTTRGDGRASFYERHGKRALDLAIAIPATLLLAPVMAAVAVAVRLRLGRPILFRQERSGWRGRRFENLKFRTMTDRIGPDGRELSDAERITPLGALLRSWSLDELPALWNVIRGDMSIVGPRPLLPEYDPLYTPEQARRLEVVPGLTGWVQVNGRNSLDWPQKLAMDVWYVDNRSFRLDLKIILRTASAVLRREGINQPDGDPMVSFTGSAGDGASPTESGADGQPGSTSTPKPDATPSEFPKLGGVVLWFALSLLDAGRGV
jgi:lipopolysaccharide/colanic/teichoic acid biosynthesis glycosyltransferase